MMTTCTHCSLYTRRLHRYMYTAHLHTCICICIYVQDYRYMYLIACVSVPISYVSYLERMWALWRRKLSVCSSSSQDFTSMASSTRSYLGLLSVYKDCLSMLLYPIVISIPVLHYTHIHMYVHNVCIVHVYMYTHSWQLYTCSNACLSTCTLWIYMYIYVHTHVVYFLFAVMCVACMHVSFCMCNIQVHEFSWISCW